MAEYVANALQDVPSGENVLFTEDIIPCTRGNIYHRAGSGIFTLRGNTNNCFARYIVFFGGNIALPSDCTAQEISVTLAIGGETIPTSKAIVTPAAAEEFWNVNAFAYVTVPKGCCFTAAVENTSGVDIEVQNANLVINRVA